MREQLRHFRLCMIGAMSVACILATAPVSNAVELTAPVVTTTGTYQGLKNYREIRRAASTSSSVSAMARRR